MNWLSTRSQPCVPEAIWLCCLQRRAKKTSPRALVTSITLSLAIRRPSARGFSQQGELAAQWMAPTCRSMYAKLAVRDGFSDRFETYWYCARGLMTGRALPSIRCSCNEPVIAYPETRLQIRRDQGD